MNFILKNNIICCLTPAAFGIWDTSNHKYLADHLINYKKDFLDRKENGQSRIDMLRNLSLRRDLLTPNYKNINSALVCIDQATLNYFHFLFFILPEILCMVEWAKNNNFKYERIVLSGKSAFVEEYFSIFDIKGKIHSIRKSPNAYHNNKWEQHSLLIEKAILTPIHFSKTTNNYNQKLKSNLSVLKKLFSYNKIIGNGKVNPDLKIFIERRDSNNNSKLRKVCPNEKFHFDLTRNGYKIIYLEDYDVKEQIRLFSMSKIIAAVHGAGLSNIIYMNKNATLIEIFHEKGCPDCFELLANECRIVNHFKISLPGLLTPKEEKILMEKLNQGNNCLPLKYTYELKNILFNSFI